MARLPQNQEPNLLVGYHTSDDAGIYKLTFYLSEYYQRHERRSFYPYVDVVFEIDGDGQPLWQQTWPAAHTMLAGILPLPDGGYLIAGSLYTDPEFNILLIRTGGGPGGEGGQPE